MEFHRKSHGNIIYTKLSGGSHLTVSLCVFHGINSNQGTLELCPCTRALLWMLKVGAHPSRSAKASNRCCFLKSEIEFQQLQYHPKESEALFLISIIIDIIDFPLTYLSWLFLSMWLRYHHYISHVSCLNATSLEWPRASLGELHGDWMTKTTIPSTDPTLGAWRIEHSPCHAEDLQAFEVHKVERLEMPPTLEQCHVLSHMMQHHRPAQFLVLIDLTPKFRSHTVIKSVHRYLETSLVISSFSPVCLLVFYLCVTSIIFY